MSYVFYFALCNVCVFYRDEQALAEEEKQFATERAVHHKVLLLE